MFNSHIFSRFLRLVRSIRRSLFAFFVAIAMLLATFVIAPTSALSAGGAGEKVSTGETVGAQSGSAKTEGENKQQTKQSEYNNTESDKNNKESNPVENRQNADVSADKAKSDSAVNKKVKDVPKESASTETSSEMDRGARKTTDLPKECGNKPFKKCYVVSYYNDKSVVDNNNPVPIQRGNAITIKPKFELKSKKQPASMPNGVWFELEKYGKAPVPSWANFEKEEKGKTIKVKDTSKDKKALMVL
ncbi:hypothetical protein [Gardnerella leopoldii]|uniref:hypothetical protein n=1 Tax=Gardnerella leopoldii TaxID=2792978 RepID=UPI001F289C0E|nr:hypothetical protein [Gardnerella leopoldii]